MTKRITESWRRHTYAGLLVVVFGSLFPNISAAQDFCNVQSDCEAGYYCDIANNICRAKQCEIDQNCPLGKICDDYQCITDLDADRDRDGVPDYHDSCPDDVNTSQEDMDGDGLGDKCDQDIDGDGDLNENDNCPLVVNSSQTDRDNDGTGDACEPDNDQDGVPDDIDNCPSDANAGQADQDKDGAGDICDYDPDGDGLNGTSDLCPDDPINKSRAWDEPDLDNNNIPDVCEDDDEDDVTDVTDNCVWIAAGGITGSRYKNGAILANAPNAASEVHSYHGRCLNSSSSNERYCYNTRNPDQANVDHDDFGDLCDDDIDGDGELNSTDNCVYVYNPDQQTYGNPLGNACNPDIDSDGIANAVDNCPYSPGMGDSQVDTDGDGFGDVCDLCDQHASAHNTDTDNDGRGDVCDNDMDGDGWLNNDDNCPGWPNSDQQDTNANGIGDVCE